MFRFSLLILVSVTALAGDLPIAEVLRRAELQNPSLLAQDHEGRVAEALVDQAGVRPNPTLNVALENVAGTGAFRGADGLETTVQISQVFERGGKREKRIAVAGHEREVAELGLAVRRVEVAAGVASAYMDVLAAQERLALAGASLELAEAISAAVGVRVEAAEASAVEAARARAALALVRAEQVRAENGLAQARAALAATWGGEAVEVPVLAGGFPRPVGLPEPEGLLEKLAEHPRAAWQRATVSSRRAALQLAHAQSSQDITVGGGVRFFREGTDAAFIAGVAVPLPFRNANQGNLRAARETLAGAEQTVRALDAESRAAFSAAWQDARAAERIARDLRAEAWSATEEALGVVRGAYARGELSLLEVFEAQRTRSALCRELLDVEAAFATALIRIDALTDATFPLTTALLAAR